MDDPFEAAMEQARALAGPLDARLAVMRDACRILTPDYDAATDRLVARLVAGGVGEAAPAPGDPMPDFVLPDERGRLWTLADLVSDGPAVIALHRGEWCDFCQINLFALAEAHPRIRTAGGRLVAIAPQRAAWGNRHLARAGADFPMLADMGCGYATELGLTIHIDDVLADALAAFDIDLAETNGDAGRLLPVPATFVLARGGRIVARHIDPDPRRRMDIEEMLQALSRASGSA